MLALPLCSEIAKDKSKYTIGATYIIRHALIICIVILVAAASCYRQLIPAVIIPDVTCILVD